MLRVLLSSTFVNETILIPRASATRLHSKTTCLLKLWAIGTRRRQTKRFIGVLLRSITSLSVWEIISKPFNGPYRDDVHGGNFNTGRLRNPFQTAKVNFL